VFHADFSGVFHLAHRAAHDGGQTGCGHGASHADFALAADFGAADGGEMKIRMLLVGQH
jgi:hypothetical protein